MTAQEAARAILGSHYDQKAQDSIALDWERQGAGPREGEEFERGMQAWMQGVGRLRMGAEGRRG